MRADADTCGPPPPLSNHRGMDITIPSGQPTWRFMGYIQPPDEGTKLEPIYPLRPATRAIKLVFCTPFSA